MLPPLSLVVGSLHPAVQSHAHQKGNVLLAQLETAIVAVADTSGSHVSSDRRHKLPNTRNACQGDGPEAVR